jgi:UDP-N-acetylmuramate--alanine ligase
MADVRPPSRTLLPPPGATVYLLGVAGAGMSGLAVLLSAEGYRVTGSDARPTPESRRLARHGVHLVEEDDLGEALGSDLVIYTSAAPAGHPILAAASAAGVPVLKRARAMGALLNERRLIAISGTHGKTTVTAMTARVAMAAGLDPTVLVGGRVDEWDGNARIGSGVAIAEADEYDRSFLELDPSLTVITSVEPEHLECYDGWQHLRDSFREIARRAAGRDGVLACAEGPGVKDAMLGVEQVSTYGLDAGADYRVRVLSREGASQTCRLDSAHGSFDFRLGAPGDHNAQNAGAALAVGLRLGASVSTLEESLAGFSGVNRRLQRLGERDGRTIIDDYAHYPTEVRVSIDAVRRGWPGRPVAVVFQPHLYSRTQRLGPDFAAALAGADVARVLPIYPAREEPIAGVTSALVTDAADRVDPIRRDEVPDWIDRLDSDAVVVFMGAGDVTRIAHEMAEGREANGVGV